VQLFRPPHRYNINIMEALLREDYIVIFCCALVPVSTVFPDASYCFVVLVSVFNLLFNPLNCTTQRA
jgi:hypothetical protein